MKVAKYSYIYKDAYHGKTRYLLLSYTGVKNDYSIYEVSIDDLKRFKLNDIKMLKRIKERTCIRLEDSPRSTFLYMAQLGGEVNE